MQLDSLNFQGLLVDNDVNGLGCCWYRGGRFHQTSWTSEIKPSATAATTQRLPFLINSVVNCAVRTTELPNTAYYVNVDSRDDNGTLYLRTGAVEVMEQMSGTVKDMTWETIAGPRLRWRLGYALGSATDEVSVSRDRIQLQPLLQNPPAKCADLLEKAKT